jgi:hypothetical protein
VAGSLAATGVAHASAYSDAVLALNPSHYYRLDETVADQTQQLVTDFETGPGPSIHGRHEGPFEDGPPPPPPVPAGIGYAGAPGAALRLADASERALPGMSPNNLSLFNNNSSGVNLGPGNNFATDTMTVAMWFRGPGGVQVGDRIFTNNVLTPTADSTADHFQIVMPNGASGWQIAVATFSGDDTSVGQLGLPSNINAVQDNQWHHVVAVRNGDNRSGIVLIVDGVDYTSQLTPTSAGWGTTGDNAHIGVRADAGGSDHNHNGSVDDTAIFLNTALTVAQAQKLYDTALGYLIADTNNDGNVDVADLGELATEFNTAPDAPFRDGADFNRDNIVNVSDLGILATHFNQPRAIGGLTFEQALAGYPALAAAAAAVPEPAFAGLAGLGALAMLRRRRR